MAKKEPSPKQTTLAGKTLRNPRTSKREKSLAGTLLALDPRKGQKPKRRRRPKK